ncbi:acyltransferase family protein [Modestobacter sp. SYSU DS0657]
MAELQRAPRGEIRALTGLRLVAALWVVAHHVWLFSPDPSWRAHLAPLAPVLEAGWLGVDLFFVLSGFVLAHTYVAVLGRRPGVRAVAGFYWARLARIWPTWLVVLSAVSAGLLVQRALLGAAATAGGASLDPASMVRQVLLVQVWDQPDNSATGPVGPGWSLSAEWLAYLAFPLLALVLHRLRRWPVTVLGALALAVVAPFVSRCLALGGHDWAWSWLVRLTGCFVAGALVALCVAQVRGTAAVARAAGWVGGGSLAVLLLVVGSAGGAGAGRAGLAVLCFPVLVGALALADGSLARVLATGPVVLGGRISFALYLVHMAVFETAWTVVHLVPALGALQALVPLLPLPVAWGLWRSVEEPARRRLRRPRAHPVAAPPAAGRGRVDSPVAVTG